MAEKEGSNWAREEDTEKKWFEVVATGVLYVRAEVAFAQRSFQRRRPSVQGGCQ